MKKRVLMFTYFFNGYEVAELEIEGKGKAETIVKNLIKTGDYKGIKYPQIQKDFREAVMQSEDDGKTWTLDSESVKLIDCTEIRAKVQKERLESAKKNS